MRVSAAVALPRESSDGLKSVFHPIPFPITARVRALSWLVGLAGTISFFGLALLRHQSFHSGAYDLGFFDQVLWSAAQGNGLRSTFIPYGFFGQHFEPVLLLFVPLYRLAPSPIWLLGAQSVALGLAVVPLGAIARRLVGPRAAWVAMAAYLLQVGVARAVDADFHPEALAVPFVFLAVVLGLQHRWLLYGLCSAVPLLTKEDGALVAIAIGLLVFLMTRRAVSLAFVPAALAYGVVLLFWVMPNLRGGASGDLIGRYTYLGSTAGEVALHLLTRPGVWIGHVISSPAPLALLVLLAAVGFLPMLRPGALAIAVLPLVPALLSTDPYQAALQVQYAVPAVPFFLIAALLGWLRIALLPGGLLLLLGALVTGMGLAPFMARLPVELSDLGRAAAVNQLLDRIPPRAEVAASTGLVPHLSERPSVWEFPAGFGASWVVIDARSSPSRQSLAAGYTDAVARVSGAGYQIEAQAAGVTLWRRVP